MNKIIDLEKRLYTPLEKPIWYYKELKETDIYTVVWKLLKEDYVVDIDGEKYEVTFGITNEGEIGCYVRGGEICEEIVNNKIIINAFRRGTWYMVLDTDTSGEFKRRYSNELKERYKKEAYTSLKNGFINLTEVSNLDEIEKEKILNLIKEISFEEIIELANKKK